MSCFRFSKNLEIALLTVSFSSREKCLKSFIFVRLYLLLDCKFLGNTLIFQSTNLMKKGMNTVLFKMFFKVCSVEISSGSLAETQKWPNHSRHRVKLPWGKGEPLPLHHVLFLGILFILSWLVLRNKRLKKNLESSRKNLDRESGPGRKLWSLITILSSWTRGDR